MKKYKCMNIGNCKIAGTKETFEIAEGEELVCPKCGSSMVVEVSGKKPLPFIIGGVVALGVLGGAGYAIFGGNGGGYTPQCTDSTYVDSVKIDDMTTYVYHLHRTTDCNVDTTDVETIKEEPEEEIAKPECLDSTYVDTVKVDDKTTNIYHLHRRTDCVVDTTKVETIIKEESKKQQSSSGNTNSGVSFDGTTMTFKRAGIIPGTNLRAQPGDKVVGVWKHGEVNSARWYHADGRASEVITHK